jgi:hypothetical protein
MRYIWTSDVIWCREFYFPETGIFTSKHMNATEHDINNPSKNPNDNKHK